MRCKGIRFDVFKLKKKQDGDSKHEFKFSFDEFI